VTQKRDVEPDHAPVASEEGAGKPAAGRGASAAVWREALASTSLGWDLALPIFGGVLLGHLVDRWLGTGYVFTLGLLVLGIIAGYYNLLTFVQRLDRRDRRRDSEEETER
jgi:F0F1-type ATP synthase assembly protein I